MRTHLLLGPIPKRGHQFEDQCENFELAATEVRLTDVNFASKASERGEDIRPDAVERGALLLADPNWPNDSVLEGLARKLLDNEDFNA